MKSHYDVVIVGAGSAGCALAYRLSSDPSRSVALIESGGSDDRDSIRVPGRFFSNWGTDVDWRYESIPQGGAGGRIQPMPRGRVLGGTSSINGMIYLRGAATDYDRWAELGCSGWEWESVRTEFEALEQMLRPAVLDPAHDLPGAMVEAAIEAGYPRSATFNSGWLDGAGWNKSTIAKGERRSSYQAFVAPFASRRNLEIVPDTDVARLVINRGRCTGVEIRSSDGTAQVIQADEVVLCAGAFNSPKLLMLSGIGPAEELQQLGIDCVADLPVGRNLIDHLLIGVVFNSRRPISDLNEYCTEACLFTRSRPELADCDLEISFATKPHFCPEPADSAPRFTIIPGIVRPKSRGTVRLRSANPMVPPVIDPNYFSHPDDMQAMIQAVRISREIADQHALKSWNGGEYFPGVEVSSNAEIQRYVEQHVSTWFHPVGTCRMGIGQDAVVSPDLRVKEIAGLRVADASVMPDIVSVNTNAASIMIGWKAGSIMLGLQSDSACGAHS